MDISLVWILPSIAALLIFFGLYFSKNQDIFPPFVFEAVLVTGTGIFAGYFWHYTLGFIPIFVVLAIYCFFNAYKDWDSDYSGVIFLIYALLTIWGIAVMCFTSLCFYLLS